MGAIEQTSIEKKCNIQLAAANPVKKKASGGYKLGNKLMLLLQVLFAVGLPAAHFLPGTLGVLSVLFRVSAFGTDSRHLQLFRLFKLGTVLL